MLDAVLKTNCMLDADIPLNEDAKYNGFFLIY